MYTPSEHTSRRENIRYMLTCVVVASHRAPFTGFFGSLQYLCPQHTVMTTNAMQSAEDVRTHPMFNALVCLPITGPYVRVNSVQAVVASQEIGKDGFFSASYDNTETDLTNPLHHLMKTVLLECAVDNPTSADPFVSEVDSCHSCLPASGAKLQLGVCIFRAVLYSHSLARAHTRTQMRTRAPVYRPGR